MKRVLLIGPVYYNFLPAVASAFQDLGWETFVEGYDVPVHPYPVWMQVRYKLSRDQAALRQKSRDSYRLYIEKRFRDCKPDLVFILNGDILETETLDGFRRTAKVALWFFDNRTRLPLAEDHARHVDAFFCFDQADVDWYLAHGQEARFLPQACDTAVYHPIPGTVKDIDILFVGNSFYSPRRKTLLAAVASRFRHRKVRVYGWYQPWFKGLGAWLRRPYKSVFRNVNVSSRQANNLYNRAKVVLNIHQEHQQDGANPRVFEICGAGAYQVCDWNPYVASLFPGGSVGFYGSEEELFARIEEALARDTASEAATACEQVRAQHTFKNRIETVLSLVFGSFAAGDGLLPPSPTG